MPSGRGTLDEVTGVWPVDHHDVGVDGRGVDAAGSSARILACSMVLGEPLEVEVERIQTGRREDADVGRMPPPIRLRQMRRGTGAAGTSGAKFGTLAMSVPPVRRRCDHLGEQLLGAADVLDRRRRRRRRRSRSPTDVGQPDLEVGLDEARHPLLGAGFCVDSRHR